MKLIARDKSNIFTPVSLFLGRLLKEKCGTCTPYCETFGKWAVRLLPANCHPSFAFHLFKTSMANKVVRCLAGQDPRVTVLVRWFFYPVPYVLTNGTSALLSWSGSSPDSLPITFGRQTSSCTSSMHCLSVMRHRRIGAQVPSTVTVLVELVSRLARAKKSEVVEPGRT